MKAIIGLGNVGEKYTNTRHNVGFLLLDKLAKNIEKQTSENLEWKNETKFKAHTIKSKINAHEILLVKPTTFMNLSGESVRSIINFFKLTPKDIIVIYDDVDLPLGTTRFREKGSAGTHNGMKSIIEQLGTEEFPRIRIGIESRGEFAPKSQDLHSFVLSDFLSTEEKILDDSLNAGITKIEELLKIA
ncbi:aminoacyl-tRNA hydrolase [Candidatus Peregrinibacteria bacterium CG10_big_fil_rev_8_21_14_0_10_36_19]|nr:MAG: aminoacyl-tRNA hydrolase [Candidatus Peregrinibacteria bacterium CG10_big_fil_rev_8_21_14_0_10_36_19]